MNNVFIKMYSVWKQKIWIFKQKEASGFSSSLEIKTHFSNVPKLDDIIWKAGKKLLLEGNFISKINLGQLGFMTGDHLLKAKK